MHRCRQRARPPQVAHLAVALLLGLSAAACASVGEVESPAAPTQADKAKLTSVIGQALDEELVAHPELPGELVAMRSAAVDGTVEVARGSANRASGEALEPTHSVLIASVTKTFTAAAILRLVEDGRLRLTDGLANAGLPTALLELLRRGGYDPDAITVGQLLSHTSGLADYADNDAGVVGGDYAQAVLADPGHHWTREEQVGRAMQAGPPLSPPGRSFHYSDTGYVLAGALIEAKTGLPLGAGLRSLLRYDRLGLVSTYLADGEDRPLVATRRAHQYVGGLDVAAIDPSVDVYGGGGLVTTMADLALFYAELFGGGVFDRKETLAAMTTLSAGGEASGAGLGVFQGRLGNATCWFHDGFWGVAVITCPQLDLTIARSWNQAEPGDGFDPVALLATTAAAIGKAAS